MRAVPLTDAGGRVLTLWKGPFQIATCVIMASTANAQALQPCEVDLGAPSAVARATLAISVATQALPQAQQLGQFPQLAAGQTDTAAAKASLRKAMGYVSASTSLANPDGHTLMTGRILWTWLQFQGTPATMTRAQLGYPSDPAGTVDLKAAVDSLFKVIETRHPQCVPELAVRRKFMKG